MRIKFNTTTHINYELSCSKNRTDTASWYVVERKKKKQGRVSEENKAGKGTGTI